jgi:hypothetical protein
MSAVKHENLLDSMFVLLSREPGVKMTERRSLVVGTREAGIPRELLSESWRRWKSRAAESAEPGSLDRDTGLFLLACLVHEEDLSAALQSGASRMLAGAGVKPECLERVWQAAPRLADLPFSERIRRIAALTDSGDETAASIPGRGIYIANQVTEEGFDELQTLVLAKHLGIMAAIDGPPGVGKTQSIIECCAILGQPLFTKTCSSRTSEAHLISYPMLVSDNGVTVTTQVNGPLCQAMEAGGVFYGDEFNLLKEDVQKRLNSAFDERRSIDRSDGQVVQARPGFWAVISYNPSQNLSSRDLEDSVADRFIHLHYRRWDPDFKAWIAWLKSNGAKPDQLDEQNEFGIKLGWRGIDAAKMKFYAGERKDGRVVWRDFFTGKESPSAPPYTYLVHDTGSLLAERGEKQAKALEILARQSFGEEDLLRMIARFTEILQNISATGDAPLLKKIGLGNLREKEDLDVLKLHETSARIEMAAARHHRFLTGQGCNRYLAQSYAVRLVIDQACYGQYRNRKLREMSAHELAVSIARSMMLIVLGAQFNTGFSPEKLLGKVPHDPK